MKLYLVQHGKAASKETDPLRPLTEQGRNDVSKIAEFIKPFSLCVDCIWHSGKTRAEQTAEILAQAVKSNKGILQRDGLAPNDNVSALKDEVASVKDDLMIVGHLPFLSKLASMLIIGCYLDDVVAFRQGGIICLERSEDDKWLISWMVTPELLAAID